MEFVKGFVGLAIFTGSGVVTIAKSGVRNVLIPWPFCGDAKTKGEEKGSHDRFGRRTQLRSGRDSTTCTKPTSY